MWYEGWWVTGIVPVTQTSFTFIFYAFKLGWTGFIKKLNRQQGWDLNFKCFQQLQFKQFFLLWDIKHTSTFKLTFFYFLEYWVHLIQGQFVKTPWNGNIVTVCWPVQETPHDSSTQQLTWRSARHEAVSSPQQAEFDCAGHFLQAISCRSPPPPRFYLPVTI